MHKEPKRKGLKRLPHTGPSVFDMLAKPEPDGPMQKGLLRCKLIHDLLRANGQENASPNHPGLHRQFLQKIRALANHSAAFTASHEPHKTELALLANIDSRSIYVIKELLDLSKRLSGNKILKIPADCINALAAVELERNFGITWDSNVMIVAPKQRRQYNLRY